MDEVAWLDAATQAELVRSRQADPVELVEASIRRIEALDPILNAVTIRAFDRALAESASRDLPNGPFRGVPILLKDLGAGIADFPQYRGNRLLREIGFRCPADTPLGMRLRRAGFVVVGSTNTSEFGWQPTTQPLAFGPTLNPWDTTRSPGGSSGGSAAAVASGMVAVAVGTDSGGSIRTPASACGLVGLKPSRGRTSVGSGIARTVVEHVLTRTVRDTAAVLDAVCGPSPGDLYVAPPPKRPYVLEMLEDPGRLRVGMLTRVDASDVRVHRECVTATEDAGRVLESLGHAVEPVGPAALFDDEFVRRVELHGSCGLRAMLDTLSAVVGRPITPADVEPYTRARAESGRLASVVEFLAAAEWLQAYASRVARWWAEGWDLLLTPTSGEPADTLETLVPPEHDPCAVLPHFRRIWCFSAPFSVTGQPAISLPLSWTADGLPVGVQLVADFGREDLLLRVASQLERARPWSGRRPAVRAQ